MTKNMKRMTALACAAMMIASMGITGCGKADGQTKDETKTTAVETPAGTETSATTENEAEKLPDGTSQESGAADTEAASESDPMMGTIVSVEDGQLTMHRQDNGFDEDVVITIAEDTKVLDAENGYPVELSDLKEGNTISAYVDEAMTLSLPPIANGLLILVQASAVILFIFFVIIKFLLLSCIGLCRTALFYSSLLQIPICGYPDFSGLLTLPVYSNFSGSSAVFCFCTVILTYKP